MAKVLADPYRLKILVELTKRPMSVSQFYRRFGGASMSAIWRHFQILEEFDWLEKVEKKTGGRRRGATEHFYRAARPALFDNETWSILPETMKDSVTAETFSTYAERVKQAIAAGTLNARDDRHFTWMGLSLDREGWENIVSRADELFQFVFEEQARAGRRLADSEEKAIPVTVALAAFESPEDTADDH